MLTVACVAVSLIGCLWLVRPQRSVLVPGSLIFDSQNALRLGFSKAQSDQIFADSDFIEPWDLIRSRLLGLAFLTVGVTGFFGHASIGVLVSEVLFVTYCFAIASVNAAKKAAEIAVAESEATTVSKRIDAFLALILFVVAIDAALLWLLPVLDARILGAVVLAVVPLAYYIAISRAGEGKTRFSEALDWRRRLGWITTVLSLANVSAFAYGTFYVNSHALTAIALRVWPLLGMTLVIFYTRRIFAASNDQLRGGFH